MRSTIFLGLAALLVACVLANSYDSISNDKVKAAWMFALNKMGVSPGNIEGIDKNWDGKLPENVDEVKKLIASFNTNDGTEQDADKLLACLRETAAHKDDPSWKTIYAKGFVDQLKADPSLVALFEQNAPDKIPSDANQIIEMLKKYGFSDEHAQGFAKMTLWLRNFNI